MNITFNKFSIIIPNYNWWQFLEWCLNSILRQSYSNYEIIIVDGKSNDNSHDIINKYTTLTNKIIWVNQIDKWISNWFNIGLWASSGAYILYLGSDDYLYDNILEKVNQYINHIVNYGLMNMDQVNIFCDSINYFSEQNFFDKRIFPTKKISIDNLIRYWNLIWLQSLFFNRQWIIKNELDESNKYSMDYEVYFRMINDGQYFIHLPEINNIIYHGLNISSRFKKESQKEAFRVSYGYVKKPIHYMYMVKRWLISLLF